jgi:hypothetical protein
MRPPKEIMGVVENWSENRAPKLEINPDELVDVEETSVSFHEVASNPELDPVGKVYLNQLSKPRQVPKPLPRREVY